MFGNARIGAPVSCHLATVPPHIVFELLASFYFIQNQDYCLFLLHPKSRTKEEQGHVGDRAFAQSFDRFDRLQMKSALHYFGNSRKIAVEPLHRKSYDKQSREH